MADHDPSGEGARPAHLRTADRVFTIPPGQPFLPALARGILERSGGDPLELARWTVLLPTRRACRALRDTFLALTAGRPLLLPRLMPLGEMDEDEIAFDDGPGQLAAELPPPLPPLRRQLLLARLVMAMGGGRGGQAPSCDQAAQLAAELARLLDQVHGEGASFDRLAELVPADYAAHWQITLDFLAVLTTHWPRLLAAEGCLDAALRRRRLLEAQAEAWRRAPPDRPILAAGSTGSLPATAALLAVVATLPRGLVVLPGLDQAMDAASWAALDATHPQSGLKAMLERIGLAPAAVRRWAEEPRPARARLVAEAMRPAATTDAWRRLGSLPAEALAGLTRVDAPGPREEAGAIALMMRQGLETEGRTVALVTPDRGLARRVAGELRRWGLAVDDSAGQPLALTPPGVFLRLTAAMVAEDFAPHATLAALKHPLATGGIAAGVFRARVRRLERAALRGPRPAPGLDGLRQAATAADAADLAAWLDELGHGASALAALMERPAAPLGALLRAHVGCAEALAADQRSAGAERLWRGEAGEAAALFVAELADAADALEPVPGRHYPALLDTLMAGRVVRPTWLGHPRLHIWGPLEARLQHADRLILGGLNEGTWPPEAGADPWMSRPMRRDFGLPLPERRVGLSAHDFAQACCAAEVVLTRSVRVGGAPTVPSRWLLRLGAVLQAGGLGGEPPPPWLAWFTALDSPAAIRQAKPPAPQPPVNARPRRLSATEVETWMRDPYAIYARRVLGLKALEPIDADPGAADYGSIVHAALEAFLRAHPAVLPDGVEAEMLRLGTAAFGRALARPGVWAFWWPRYERIVAWVAARERERRGGIERVVAEAWGRLALAGPAGPFEIVAKADRIELRRDGTLALLDYKTGAPPSTREVAAGFAPQLPIEAAIARAGGFDGVPAWPVGALTYWRLKGGEEGGRELAAGDDPTALATAALAGLNGLIAAFDDAATPYAARPHPDKAPRYSDYLHLARVKEWASAAEEE